MKFIVKGAKKSVVGAMQLERKLALELPVNGGKQYYYAPPTWSPALGRAVDGGEFFDLLFKLSDFIWLNRRWKR